MFANVFTKTVRDRTFGMLIAAVSIGVMLAFSLAVYRDVDTSFYYDLPTAVQDLFGIPQGGEGLGGVAFGAMYNAIAAFVLAGLAITMGAAAIAGEERNGTIGILLGNPRSRRNIVVSNSLALVAVVGVGALLLWGFGVWAPELLDADITGVHVGAATFALFVNALVYGFLALAIGAWTGNRGAASGTAVAVMVVGYLAASILPLIEGLENVAKIFPWYYYSSPQPVTNGVSWGHVGVMAGLVVAFFVVAYIGVARRDLKEKSTQVTLLDRLRANPRTQKMMERIAGSARVSRISIKTASEFQGVFVITSMIMFYLGILMGPLFALVPDELKDFFSQFPDALIAMIGGADMSTPAGFLQGEIFSLTGPVAFIVLTAVMGSRAIAGEEERHTMGLLLGNPITRTHVVVEKTIAMVFYAIVLGVITFVAVWAGVLLGGLDVSGWDIAATSALLVLLGLVFGGLALAIGAATGRSRLSGGITAAVGVAAYFVWSFFPLSPSFEGWALLSPFHYYLGSDPLVNGMDWSDAAVLAVSFLALIALAVPLWERRDLRG